jgi:type IX secretion system PorP/SprF family membrane protein
MYPMIIVIFGGNNDLSGGFGVKKRLFVFVLFLLGGIFIRDVRAQDPDFSMMFQGRMYYNPAFAGFGRGRVALGFRDQYPGNAADFITTVATWDQPVDFLHGGYGVMLMHDRSAGGMLSLTGLSLSYSYHLQVSRSFFLNTGFTASLMQNHLDAGKIILPDMISPGGGVILPPGETINSESKFFPDFAVGFLFYGENWLAGVSAWHLMQPYRTEVKNDQTVLERKYSFLASYTFTRKNSGISLIPWGGGMIQGRSQLYILGGQVNYNFVDAGIAWKKSFGNQYDIAVFSLGMTTGNVSFMYSYDAFLRAPPGRAGKGAHEVGIVVNLGKTRKKQTIIFPHL